MSEVAIIFTIELSNGHFKSQLRAPFPLPAEERERIVEQWLDLMQTGFRIGATEMEAKLNAVPTRKDPKQI